MTEECGLSRSGPCGRPANGDAVGRPQASPYEVGAEIRATEAAPQSALAPLALIEPAQRSSSLGTYFFRHAGVRRSAAMVTPIALWRSRTYRTLGRPSATT
jgi:hypothetical protein